MNFYRNRVKLRGQGKFDKDSQPDQHEITLNPGDVHEASHWMPYKGDIDLSELTFHAEPVSAENASTSIQSFLDIAVFPVQEQCTSETCDISKYGAGKMDHFKNHSFVTLCDNGRLRIDSDLFQGFHTQLMVPSLGQMPRHLKYKKVALPQKDQTYEVIFANCNDAGRKVQITGQAVLDYDENQIDTSFGSVMILTTIAVSICLLFTFLTVRIRRGTQAEYNAYQRLSVVEIER
jgi:hypothetical protein